MFAATGQVPESRPSFQNVSISQVGTFPDGCNLPDMIGGPGTLNPASLTIPAMRPMDLLAAAFGLKPEQILGLSRWGFAWNGTFIYKVVAKIPRGATKAQIGSMLQDMLVKRFHLVAHRETRQLDLYDLTIAPEGTKMTQSSLTTLRPHWNSCRGTLDRNGFPQPCPGCSGMAASGKDGIAYDGARAVKPEDLTRLLADLLGRPVRDKTGLTGRYDFGFQYAMENLAGPEGRGAGPAAVIATEAGAAHLIESVRTQLGLVLKANKAPLEVLVVDYMDETPPSNQGRSGAQR
jgi:uncharacterized protein (TIGR03435 family)